MDLPEADARVALLGAVEEAVVDGHSDAPVIRVGAVGSDQHRLVVHREVASAGIPWMILNDLVDRRRNRSEGGVLVLTWRW